MIKYRKGDKVTVECTVIEDSEDSPVVQVQLDSATGSHLAGKHIFTRAIKSHIPKPVEPAAGQVWKLVEPYYAGDRKVYAVVDIDGVTHVIVQNSIPRAARILDIKSFKEGFVYVSG